MKKDSMHDEGLLLSLQKENANYGTAFKKSDSEFYSVYRVCFLSNYQLNGIIDLTRNYLVLPIHLLTEYYLLR